MVHGLKTLLLTLSLLLSFLVSAKTLQVDTVTPSVTNGDFTITPNGTGDIVLGTFSGVLKSSTGVLSVGLIDLTSEISGILPIANGGTGSSSRNYVDLASDESISGVKSFTGELKAVSTTAPSVPAPIMTTAQRDALAGSSAGDQVFNSDTNQLNVYNGSAWVPVGAGGGGLDIYHREDFESSVKSSNFSCGNNASFLGGGSIDGTVSDETSSPIAGDTSFKYVGGSSSTNDYCASPVITLADKQKGNQTYITFYYTYSGDPDDIKFVFWDVTNSVDLTNGLVLSETTTKATRKSATFYVPTGVASLRYGFQALVGNNTAELVIDDIEFTTKPITQVATEVRQYLKHEGSLGFGSTATKILRVAAPSSASEGSGILEFNDDSTDASSWTALRDCYVDFNYVFRTAASNQLHGITVDASSLTTNIDSVTASEKISWSEFPHSGNSVPTHSASFFVRAGQVIRIHTQGVGTTYSNGNFVNIVATASNPAVVTNLNSSLTEWNDYTPTTQGLGTPTFTVAKWRQVGGNMELSFKLTPSTSTAVEMQIGLPSGYTISSTHVPSIMSKGHLVRVENITTQRYTVLATGGDTFLNFGNQNSSTGLTPLNGNAITGANLLSIEASVPIEGWSAASQFLGAISPPKRVVIGDVKSSGVSGGTFTSGDDGGVYGYQKPINTIISGDSEIVSILSNQFTLKRGDYKIKVRSPAYKVNRHKAALRDVTSGVFYYGTAAWSDQTNQVFSYSYVDVNVSITEDTTFEVRHRSQTTQASDGFGLSSSFSVDEIYTTVEIEGAITNRY